jgi:elongation factor G
MIGLARVVALDHIRNIGIMAHIDAGKTTTTERILYYTGVTHRMGEVDDGSAAMDWMEQEQERGITITAAATTCFWNGYRINLIDTPGHVDFTIEVERSLRVLDGAIVIFDGVAGVEPQSETVWKQADKFGIPRLAFVNKMDRPGADFFKSLDSMRVKLHARPLPLQIPLGEGEALRGVVDLITMKAWAYEESTPGARYEWIEIPSPLRKRAETYRDHLLETVADQSDTLLERYIEGRQIPVEEIKNAVRQATLSLKIVPVLCGSAFKNKGIQPLLDAIVDYLPSPKDVPPVLGKNPRGEVEKRSADDDQPFTALAFKVMADPFVGSLTYFRVYSGAIPKGAHVFNASKGKRERLGRLLKMHANKREQIQAVYSGDIFAAVGLRHTTTGDTVCDEAHPIVLESIEAPAPVLSVAVEPRSKGEQEKLGQALHRLAMEDPSFQVKTDRETGQTILAGMGELHLEVLMERLQREFKVEARVGRPQVAYRETLTRSAEGEGRFVKQTGGHGQYGHVRLRVDPGTPGQGFQFDNAVVGGRVPSQFVPAVEKGILEAMERGVLAGYPVVDIQVTLLDGSYHEVDSSEMAFKIAASLGFKEAAKRAGPVLLEPIMAVDVIVPEEFLGEIIGDLNGRRGKILRIDSRPGTHVLASEVPLAEMFGYATDLRSKTQGRATFTMQFSRYSPAPRQMDQEIISRKVHHITTPL